jgi:p-aminobenzoyl-glutamate transporter AbgT
MEQITEISHSISDFGFMVVCSGIYLICSATILFLFIKWFVRIVDNIIERQQKILDEILQLQREQKQMLERLEMKY